MVTAPPAEITALLARLRDGDQTAAERLFPLVYDQLRHLARHYLQQESLQHTLQPTALVHELYLRLFNPLGDSEPITWHDRQHFFAVAARQMRRLLVDHARAKHAAKRAGDWQRVELTADAAHTAPLSIDLLALDQTLARLEADHPRAAKVVELRYFGGLTEAEAAEALGIGLTTLKRDWEFARAWLYQQLKPASEKDGFNQ